MWLVLRQQVTLQPPKDTAPRSDAGPSTNVLICDAYLDVDDTNQSQGDFLKFAFKR